MNALATKLEPKNYEHLIGLDGISEKLLRNHFKLYEGYVTNTNLIAEELDALLDDDKAKTPHFAELKRRFGWEFNGVRLHEYYFDNLTTERDAEGETEAQRWLSKHFGSFERWKKDFVASGAMRGIGWVVLAYDPPSQKLINFWIEEHNTNHLAGSRPLLIMDVFEHAFMIDYGTDKSKYIEAFFKNINWGAVSERIGTL